ncbi:GNAT family N-acetyltransferase [Pedobacter nyackensis]|uniref:GNAT family N-acetyltransferase n=1 Tax=Pedobacter nyackensis TaxID=475255 RepID=UPI002931435A|nr:GNAT family N-acetyltransferase [Pedobacter nyackensis]
MKEIETSRLYLKATDIEDAPFILELLNTPKWIRFIGDRNVKDLAGATEYIKNRMMPQMEELGFGNYVLVRKEDGAKIGSCGLYKREGLDGVDIGFAMLPDFEGKGYSGEAAIKLKQLAKTEFHLERLNGITSHDNTASINLLKKLGLKLKGTVRLPNDTEDLLLYSTIL